MKKIKIAIFVLYPLCFSLVGCGRSMSPQPQEDVEITYPKTYPKPE